MSDGTTTPLKGKGNYKSLAFDEAGAQLAFLSDQAEYDKQVSPYRLYYWKAGDAAATELVSATTRGMPQGMVVSDHSAPRFSEDGARLFLGTAPPPRAAGEPKARRRRCASTSGAGRTRRFSRCSRCARSRSAIATTAPSCTCPTSGFVQLATPDLPTVNPGEDPIRADRHLRPPVSAGDVLGHDLQRRVPRRPQDRPAPASARALARHAVDVARRQLPALLRRDRGRLVHLPDLGRHAASTSPNAAGEVLRRESRHAESAAGASASAGWTDGDKSVLLYDQFDIWEIRPDGTNARMVTNGEGRKQQLVFRYRSLDPERAHDSDRQAACCSRPTNDETKATGYYRVACTGTAAPEKIVMLDKALGALTKAKNADVVVFTQSRFDEFPDLWVSDTNFARPKKVSNANPAAVRIRLGQGRAHQVHQRRRQDAAARC